VHRRIPSGEGGAPLPRFLHTGMAAKNAPYLLDRIHHKSLTRLYTQEPSNFITVTYRCRTYFSYKNVFCCLFIRVMSRLGLLISDTMQKNAPGCTIFIYKHIKKILERQRDSPSSDTLTLLAGFGHSTDSRHVRTWIRLPDASQVAM